MFFRTYKYTKYLSHKHSHRKYRNTSYYMNLKISHYSWGFRIIFPLRSRSPLFFIVLKKKNERKHKRRVCYFNSKETLVLIGHYNSKSLWRSLHTKSTKKRNWWKWCPHDSLLSLNWKAVMSRPVPILCSHFVFFLFCLT